MDSTGYIVVNTLCMPVSIVLGMLSHESWRKSQKIHSWFFIVNSAGDLSGPADLNVVAMAISGFTGDDRNALWREQCRSLGASLLNPYLRTLFAFLTNGSGESYDTILVSNVFDR